MKKIEANTEKEINNDNEFQIQRDIRNLEQFYTENKVDNMMLEINEEKSALIDKMSAYAAAHTKPTKWDKEGNPTSFSVIFNPLVINNMFFKPIVPIGSIEPEYNAERLSMVFDYYCEIISEVNDKIGNFPSSLTSFCKLAGITLNTLKSYKNSSDLNMRIIVNKIYDQIGDVNITMSQLGMVNEKSTIFKMKSQNEITETIQPSVHINITEKPDIDKINQKLAKYKQFSNKKGK